MLLVILADRQACATVNGTPPYNPPYFETPLPTAGAPTICEQAKMRIVFFGRPYEAIGLAAR